jgi:eukaryotic-like serine/threonine-protein kinase
MGRNRFQTVDTLYRAAIALPPDQRAQFLDVACGGDDALRERVESLLADSASQSEVTLTVPRRQVRLERLSFGISQIINGRFEVVNLLGSGGMGDVFEVKDLHLSEHVALKTIRSDLASDARMVSRFKQEILVAKRVTHPNVCRIYDVGFHGEEPVERPPVLFLTMELLRGESLSSRLRRGRMSTTEALPIIEQMAQGLAAAHESGVVHRDFKCANVMLVPSNTGAGIRAVITDFGLARSVQESVGSGLTATLTQPGEITGTPDYMAPEQVLGVDVTFAADIYSLGVVIYEMVTGQLPFHADSPLATAGKRLLEPPAPPTRHVPDLDRTWQSVILRCLERDPKDRFASAHDVANALTGLRPVAAPRRRLLRRRRVVMVGGIASIAGLSGAVALWRAFRPSPSSSIAVLPITSTDPELDYVAEGMTEDLINIFGQRQGLRVMSRGAVYGLKDVQLSPQELGIRLNVRYLLTGRLLKKASTVSIAFELTDARDGAHAWGGQFERPVASLVDVQQDVARSVLSELDLPLEAQAQKRFAERESASAEVNELYWRARFFWNKRTQEGLQKAMQYFGEAIEKDPSFARAYAGLADCQAMRSGVVPPRQTFPSAKAAAMRAIQLDDHLAEGHASLAFTLLFFDWDWRRAEAEYLRAIELNANYPTAHSMYGMYLVAMKRFEEAMQQMKRALELDPSSLAIHTGVGRVSLYARRFDDAAAQYSKTLEMDPKFAQALFDFGMTRAAQGRFCWIVGSNPRARMQARWHRLRMCIGSPDAHKRPRSCWKVWSDCQRSAMSRLTFLLSRTSAPTTSGRSHCWRKRIRIVLTR